MSVLAAEPQHTDPAPRGPRGALRRAWAAPLWAHLAGLTVVLVALIPLVGTDAVFSADEGAAAAQAQSLARGDGWIVEHPLPEADPQGRYYPLENSERGSRGWAPFAKHPLYPLALAAADRVGGFTAMMALSILGTVVAAGLSAALARRIDPSLSRPALWVVGLASPLLFDSFIVIAHTLGAAAVTGAVLLAVMAIERRSMVLALAVGPAVALSVLLRNEALLFAVALAFTVGVIGLRRRCPPALVAAGTALLGAGLAHVAEREWLRTIVGGAAGLGSVPGGGGAFVAGRVRAWVHTWMSPSLLGRTEVSVCLFVMLLALVVGAFLVRRHPGERRRIVFLAGLAAAAALVAVAIGPSNVVPGLLIAFPLVGPALLLLRRSQMTATVARVLAGTAGLLALAVIATQYDRGGTAEWGGRYFALALPIAVPILLQALRDGGSRVERDVRRWGAGALVVCTVALGVMAVGGLRHHHRFAAGFAAAVDRAGVETEIERPVFISTTGLVPRLMWQGIEHQRWLVVGDGSKLPEVIAALRANGVAKFVLVTPQLNEYRPQLDGAVEVSSAYGATDGEGWQVRIFRTG